MFFRRYSSNYEAIPLAERQTPPLPVSEKTLTALLKLVSDTIPAALTLSEQPQISFYDRITDHLPLGGIVDYRLNKTRPDHRLLATFTKYAYKHDDDPYKLYVQLTHYDLKTHHEKHELTKRMQQGRYWGAEYDSLDLAAEPARHTPNLADFKEVTTNPFVSDAEASKVLELFGNSYGFGALPHILGYVYDLAIPED